jgi:hypothetical protein
MILVKHYTVKLCEAHIVPCILHLEIRFSFTPLWLYSQQFTRYSLDEMLGGSNSRHGHCDVSGICVTLDLMIEFIRLLYNWLQQFTNH